jgi:hypothetical protein
MTIASLRYQDLGKGSDSVIDNAARWLNPDDPDSAYREVEDAIYYSVQDQVRVGRYPRNT